MRSRAIAVVAAAAILMLSACSGIPTSGSVTVGTTIEERGGNDFEVLPLGPAADATQEEVVRGFVAAFAGSRNDYEVARQFLSADFAEQWNPRSSVVVRTPGSSDPLNTIDDDSMRYSISAAGTVDASGAFVQNDAPATLARQFDFVRVDEQWRISQTGDGIVLSDRQFHSLFRQHALYFLDPTGTALVPDLRWFLGGTAALRIVSTMLEGPPPWLRGAVRTAFPEGTQLASPNFDIQAGVARIDLSNEALDADARERQLMQVQLSESLVNVANIRRVDLSVGGASLEIDELGTSGPQADPSVDARALVLMDGEFGYLSGTSVEPLDDLGEKVVDLGATGATLAESDDAVAVVGPAGVTIVFPGGVPAITVDARADLVEPALDGFDYVWTASRSDSSVLTVYDFAGASTTVATGLPPASEIVSIDVARDDARIAILANTTAGQRLLVTAIVRDPNQDQLPLTLSEPVLDAAVEQATAIDASWADELSVATVGEEEGETTGLLFVVGGERSALGQLPGGATSIVGGNGERGVRVLSDDGTVYTRSGSGWSDTRVAVAFIATQR